MRQSAEDPDEEADPGLGISRHATRSGSRLAVQQSKVVGAVSEPEVALLLAAYDTQLRGQLADQLPEGVHAERDGPLLRLVGAK